MQGVRGLRTALGALQGAIVVLGGDGRLVAAAAVAGHKAGAVGCKDPRLRGAVFSESGHALWKSCILCRPRFAMVMMRRGAREGNATCLAAAAARQ